MKTREELFEWMRDAYAMERGLEVTLQKQAENMNLPLDLREMAREHLEETKLHAEALKTCLESMGTDISTMKTGLAKGMEMVRGAASAMISDQEVKDVLTAYAAEHFEIACYTALQSAAEQMAETRIVQLCKAILPDEERMADRLLEGLPGVISSYLNAE